MSNGTTQHTPADVRERVLTVLTAIEWAAQVDHPDGGWYACCPWCEGGDPDDEETPPGRAGHAELCELAAVIALLRTPRGEGEAWPGDAENDASFLRSWARYLRTEAQDIREAQDRADWKQQAEYTEVAAARMDQIANRIAALRSEAQGEKEDALDLIRWAEARAVALEPVAGNIMPPGTYACYVGDDDDPYMGPGILGAIRAARRGGATWTWSKGRWGMTPQELLALCAESERDGVDYIVLKVATRREPGNRMRILPGVMAEVLDTGRGYAVVRAPARKVREVVERALTAHPTDRSESDG